MSAIVVVAACVVSAIAFPPCHVAADEMVDLDKLLTLTDIYELINDHKFDQALDRLRPLVTQGNAEAQYVLGTMLETGHGVPPDKGAALKLYQQSADAGYPLAQRKIGLFFFSTKQYDQAFTMLKPLTNMGFRGMVSGALSEMYRYGRGTPADEAKADCWMRKTTEPMAKSLQGSC